MKINNKKLTPINLLNIGQNSELEPQALSKLSRNLFFHARTKHIEIDFHFVHDQVLRGQPPVKFVSTKDPYADTLTKPLSSTQFQFLHDNLRVLSLPFRLRGHVEEQDSVTAEFSFTKS
jgi:hypothetical protein